MSMSEAGAAFMAAGDAPEGDAGAEPPSAPAAPEAEAAPPGPKANEAAAPAATPDPEGEDKGPVPWGEHKKARDEAARYRTELRRYEESFGRWAPEDADVLLQAVGAVAELLAAGESDKAGQVFRAIADQFGEETANQVAQAGQQQADDDDELLTRAEMMQLLAEREAASAYEMGVQQHMADLQRTAGELGYDPHSEEWAVVLSEAINLHDGDVRAAAEAIKNREQAAIDRYLAGKRSAADGIPSVVGNGAAPAAASDAPGKIDDASERLRAFLDTQ